MRLVLGLIPALGIKLIVVVRLLEVLRLVDVDEDGLGLRCGPELQVDFAHNVRDSVDPFPLLDEFSIGSSGSGVEVDETPVSYREFPRLGFPVVVLLPQYSCFFHVLSGRLYAVPSLAAASGTYPSLYSGRGFSISKKGSLGSCLSLIHI